MIDVLIEVLLFCVIAGLIYWVLGQLPLPAPFGKIAMTVFIVICAIIAIYFLLGLLGGTGHLHGPLLHH